MSEKTTNPAVTVAAVPNEQPEPTEKQSFYAKTKQFVKDHKRPTIMVASLVGLVGVAAVAGRKTADLAVEFQPPLEIVPADDTESESTDTVA